MSEMNDAVPFRETQLGYVDSWDDAQELMRWLGQRREVLALDTETAGLSPFDSNSRIRLFQLGDINSAWTVDAQKWPGLCQEILETYQGRMTWHNVGFDSLYIQAMWPGVVFPWSKTDDTLLAARLDDNEASAALKTIGTKLYGNEASVGQKMLDEGMSRNNWDWNTVPLDFPPYTQYAALDCILGARVWHHFKHVHQGEFRQAYELEMQTRRICTNMELRGMRVDLEYCRKKSVQLEDFVEKMKDYCDRTYSVKIGSTKALGQWFKDNGAHLTEFTATGLPKMGEDELLAMEAQGFELATHALKARKAAKISGTYLENFQKFSDENGIMHPQINTMAARTHRMSITRPAAQTFPRDASGDSVRAAVIPHEGQVLLSSDLDQVEYRYLAVLSGDRNLIARFEQADEVGPDVFTQIGRDIFNDPSMKKSDPRRNTVKTLIYAKNYGAGIARQAASAGLPEDQMREIVKAYDAAHPQILSYQKQLGARLETMRRNGERPYVNTYTGRRLYVEKSHQGLNYQIQGACADIMKQNLVDLDNAGLGDYLIIPIHDEILLSAPRNSLEEIRETVIECMTTRDFDVILPADCSDAMDRWTK